MKKHGMRGSGVLDGARGGWLGVHRRVRLEAPVGPGPPRRAVGHADPEGRHPPVYRLGAGGLGDHPPTRRRARHRRARGGSLGKDRRGRAARPEDQGRPGSCEEDHRDDGEAGVPKGPARPRPDPGCHPDHEARLPRPRPARPPPSRVLRPRSRARRPPSRPRQPPLRRRPRDRARPRRAPRPDRGGRRPGRLPPIHGDDRPACDVPPARNDRSPRHGRSGCRGNDRPRGPDDHRPAAAGASRLPGVQRRRQLVPARTPRVLRHRHLDRRATAQHAVEPVGGERHHQGARQVDGQQGLQRVLLRRPELVPGDPPGRRRPARGHRDGARRQGHLGSDRQLPRPAQEPPGLRHHRQLHPQDRQRARPAAPLRRPAGRVRAANPSRPCRPRLGSTRCTPGSSPASWACRWSALYMLLFYRLLGLVAIFSLLDQHRRLLWTIICYLGAHSGLALTLAGITGIIVSIGVAVDSNVVFYEHLRRTCSQGPHLPRRRSTSRSTSAWSTIVAADFVSLIGAALLYLLHRRLGARLRLLPGPVHHPRPDHLVLLHAPGRCSGSPAGPSPSTRQWPAAASSRTGRRSPGHRRRRRRAEVRGMSDSSSASTPFDDDIDFRKGWRVAFVISCAAARRSASLRWPPTGLNLGIDFKGGTSWQFPANGTSVTPRSATRSSPLGGGDATIQTLTPATDDAAGRGRHRRSNVDKAAPTRADRRRTNRSTRSTPAATRSARRGVATCPRRPLRALIVFFIAIAIYISLRLEWRMAVGAIAGRGPRRLHQRRRVLHLPVRGHAGRRWSPSSPSSATRCTTRSSCTTRSRTTRRRLLAERRQTYTEMMNLSLNQMFMRSINTTIVGGPAGHRRSWSSAPGSWARSPSRSSASPCWSACSPARTRRSSSPRRSWRCLKEREPRYTQIRERVLARRAEVGASPVVEGSADTAGTVTADEGADADAQPPR